MYRVAILVALIALASTTPSAQTPGATTSRPNVVLIITDDIGYGDLSSYGAPDIRTPNIDRLAKEGVRFTDFYSNGVVCTPTRAALMTGRYQHRVGLEQVLTLAPASVNNGLAVTGRTLPRLLKDNGYATALFGKWHLGFRPEFGPNAHGFDYFYGFLTGAINYFTHDRGDGTSGLHENLTPVTESGYLTDILTRRSVEFIDRNAARPFFLEVAYNAGHWPFQSPHHQPDAFPKGRSLFQGPDDDTKPTRKDYAEILERADEGVGKILAALDRHKLAANTVVIFTNDNGGEWLSRNAPFFHRKGSVWEGGIRVPALIRWPGRVPAGKTVGQAGITMDLMATILTATNVRIPDGARLDGVDLIPFVQDGATPKERTLFWRTLAPGRQQRAVRHGQWKLVLDGGGAFLFDLSTDPGERQDLARSRADLVADLRQRYLSWEREVEAEAKEQGKTSGQR